MLSRIADSLFWLNRYTERCDGLLRLVYVHYILSLDRALYTSHQWRTVLEIHSASSVTTVNAIENNTPEVLTDLVLSTGNGNSLRAIIHKARENARGAQDHITKEVWEAINALYHQVNESTLPTKLRGEQAIKTIDGFARQTALLTGIADNTMNRGLGWNFMNLGKFIERCQQTIVLAKKELESQTAAGLHGDDILQWRYILLALSGYEMHLKTYRSDDYRHNALHQVLLNEDFPRSVIYSIVQIKYYLESIMESHHSVDKNLQDSMGRLFAKVRYMHLREMDNATIHSFLEEVQNDLHKFSNDLGQHYFSYS